MDMPSFTVLLTFAFISFLVGTGFNVAGIANIRLACVFWFIAMVLGVLAIWQYEPLNSWPRHWQIVVSLVIILAIVLAAWAPVKAKYKSQVEAKTRLAP